MRTWFSGKQKRSLRAFSCSGNLFPKYVFSYALDDSFFLNYEVEYVLDQFGRLGCWSRITVSHQPAQTMRK